MKTTKKIGKASSAKTKQPKTVTVAINNCYGGFSLSPLAVKTLAAERGKQCYFFRSEHVTEGEKYQTIFHRVPDEQVKDLSLFWTAATEPVLTEENYSDITLEQRPENRRDPLLIKVIKNLGAKANGGCAKIKLVKVPSNVKWHIEEYDGNEWVAEDHRTWS